MAKLTLADIAAGFGLITTYNANNALLEAALENTLSRDGTAPNTMSVNLDMNSQRIVNLAQAVIGSDAVTLQQVTDTITAAADPLTSATAALVSLLDLVGNYTATDIEAAFAEIFETPSETTRRVLEIATQAETDAGTDDERVVTPLKLETKPLAAASETAIGAVERATQAEVDAGTDTTRYVSPATLQAAPSTAIVIRKVVTADQSVTSSTTLVNITDLSGIAIDAGKQYAGRVVIPYFQNIGNIKFQFAISQTPNEAGHIRWYVVDTLGTLTEDADPVFTVSRNFTVFADGFPVFAVFDFVFDSHATLASTLDLQFAQDTSDANATIIRQGAYIEVTPLE